MPNTMHPTIEDAVINLARHEAGHAITSHLLSYTVESVEVNTCISNC